MESGKGKKMLTVFDLTYVNLHGSKQASLENKEWGFALVCSAGFDGTNTVERDVRLRLEKVE